MYNSLWLSPLTVEAQRIQGADSIRQTFEQNEERLCELLTDKPLPFSATLVLHRMAAYATRTVLSIPILGVVAPTGVVVNGVRCCFYLLLTQGNKRIESADQEQRVQACWRLFYHSFSGVKKDLLACATALFLWKVCKYPGGLLKKLSFSARTGSASLVGYLLFNRIVNKISFRGSLVGLPMDSVFVPVFISFLQVSCPLALMHLTSRKMCARLLKSMTLRSLFGIVGEDGGLLVVGQEDDENLENTGHFYSLHQRLALFLKEASEQQFKITLPVRELSKWGALENYFDEVKTALQTLKEEQQAEGQHNSEQFEQAIEEWCKRFYRLKVITRIWRASLDWETGGEKTFFFDQPRVQEIVAKEEWAILVSLQLPQIQKGESPLFENEDHQKLYEQFREGVLAGNSPQELLALTTVDESSINKAYRKLSLVLSPDKCSSGKEEAQALFNILGKAKEILSP